MDCAAMDADDFGTACSAKHGKHFFLISGFSDITPFILNLLQGTGSVAVLVITACSMQAIVSNIAVNMCYALFFAGGKSPLRPWILGGFGSVIAANICLLLFFYFL